MKLKDYLIASETNEYRPWIITPQALAVFCVIIWGLRLILPSEFTSAAPGIDPTDVMNRINAERTQRFLPALVANGKLITAATGKAQDMIARSYFAHVDPDGNYVWPRIEATGYTPYQTLGDNLAMDFTSASDLVAAWMNSPTHRANIENPKFQDQGLATASGLYEPGHDTIMVVSLFGALYQPKTASAPTQQSQAPPAPTPTATPTPKSTPTPTLSAPVAAGETDQPKDSEPVVIDSNPQISSTQISGQTQVKIQINITGSVALATARLKTQSITLLPQPAAGVYAGTFTFDAGEDLSDQALLVEARDAAGQKIDANFPINIGAQTGAVAPVAPPAIPTTNESQVIKILRIIFGIFAGIYMIFLSLDAIIIHRAKLTHPGIHSTTHTLLFLLVAAASLFTRW